MKRPLASGCRPETGSCVDSLAVEPSSPVDIENSFTSAMDSGNYSEAATVALQRFGPELLAFFHAVLRNEADAEECFGQFCEEFWRGLHRFRRECGPRTWCYVLARRTLCRYRETLNRRRKRFVSLSRIPKKLRLVAVRVRTSTLAYLRTEAKDKLARLREQLTADQQMLLVLRVDRNLSWNQIARIMEGLETVEDEELRQRAAALRKQFQRIKEKLSKLAKREGMLEPE